MVRSWCCSGRRCRGLGGLASVAAIARSSEADPARLRRADQGDESSDRERDGPSATPTRRDVRRTEWNAPQSAPPGHSRRPVSSSSPWSAGGHQGRCHRPARDDLLESHPAVHNPEDRETHEQHHGHREPDQRSVRAGVQPHGPSPGRCQDRRRGRQHPVAWVATSPGAGSVRRGGSGTDPGGPGPAVPPALSAPGPARILIVTGAEVSLRTPRAAHPGGEQSTSACTHGPPQTAVRTRGPDRAPEAPPRPGPQSLTRTRRR